MTAKAKKIKSNKTQTLELSVLSTDGKQVETINLDAQVFDGKVNHAVMHQAVVAYLANQRKGLANTKTRGEVSGVGRKPWKQKGTGRARAGSSRSPIWNGGGVSFCPKPHSFHKDFPKKMRALALKSALNAKLNDSEISVVDSFKMASHKTRDFAAIMENLKLTGVKFVLVVNGLDSNIKLATRNIPKVAIQEANNLTTYEALNCKRIVFSKDALKSVEDRIKKGLA